MLFSADTLAMKDSFKILFLGDSLTEGFSLRPQEAYPALVERALKGQYPQIEAINAGISGSTSTGAARRLEKYLPVQPDLLVLELGVNDGLRNLDLSKTKKNLAETLKLARQNQVPVLLVGMRIPNYFGRRYSEDFEQMYEELAKEWEVPLLPFLLEDVALKRELNLPDGLHPNAEGHQVIAKTVLKHLKPVLEQIID